MDKIFEEMKKYKIVPVIVIDDAEDAKDLADALCEGGIPVAEVTFRTEAAEETIRRMSSRHPDMLVGAGTVLTKEQVDRAADAGAKFIVTPGLNPEIVRYCQERNVPVCPGVATPSEVEKAMSLGLDLVKFFPAEPMGGIKMLKAISAVYSNVYFMPTGGINGENISDYLAMDRVAACGGSWMVKKDLIKTGEFDQIRNKVRELAETLVRS